MSETTSASSSRWKLHGVRGGVERRYPDRSTVLPAAAMLSGRGHKQPLMRKAPAKELRYVSSRRRIVLAAGRCFVPAWRSRLAAGGSFFSAWRIVLAAGRCFVPAWRIVLAAGRCFVPAWRIVLAAGRCFV